MPKSKAFLGCVLALLAACSGVTDPVEKRGLRVENRTQDTLVVFALSVSALTDFFVSTSQDTTPRLLTDSVRFTGVQSENEAGGLIAPGATTVFRSRDITDYDRSRDLIVSVLRVRRGFLFAANSFVLTPTEVRSSEARVVLRSGRYFPTVLP
jgi:hypothetical protein